MVLKTYHCLRCGAKFDVQILEPDEIEEAKANREPLGRPRCPQPNCGSTDVTDQI